MLRSSRRLIIKIVCVFNICEESMIIKSFEELINNDILSFHSDDCLLADTLLIFLTTWIPTPPLLPHLLKSSALVKPFILSFYPPLPLQSPSRRPSFRLSIPPSCRPSSLHPSSPHQCPSRLPSPRPPPSSLAQAPIPPHPSHATIAASLPLKSDPSLLVCQHRQHHQHLHATLRLLNCQHLC